MNAFNHREGETLRLGDADIYVEYGRNVGDPVVILLHGGFGTMKDFDPILPKLKPGFRVVGIDSRGHGKSTLGSRRLTYRQLQEDVEAVAAQLQIERCQIIGFSQGGTVGYRIAAGGKLRIDGLVTIGAKFELTDDDPAKPLLTTVTAESWRKKFPDTVTLYERLNPQPDFDALAKAVVAMWLDPSESGNPGESVSKITCKVLAARGNDDHLTTLDSLIKFSQRVKQTIVFNLPFSSHVVAADQPDMLMLGINPFLAAQ